MKSGDMSDNDLVKSCFQGNTEPYRILMDKYGGNAMAVALNMLVNYEDAEDACQEAFFKAFRHLDSFDQQKSFKNWFYALLYNHCLDQIRKRKRFFSFLTSFNREQQAAAAMKPGHSGSGHLFEFELLRHLSPNERISLYLWAQEGYSGAEIAGVLGCSPKTAHIHLYKARRKLKALLGEKDNGKLPKN
jgi:RNA polymerase sigma factor (sigma-70 family)